MIMIKSENGTQEKIVIGNVSLRHAAKLAIGLAKTGIEEKHLYSGVLGSAMPDLLSIGSQIPVSTYDRVLELKKDLFFKYIPLSENNGVLEIIGSEYSVKQVYRRLQRLKTVEEDADVKGTFYRKWCSCPNSMI